MGVPSDKVTRTYVHKINKVNIIILMIVANVYFFDEYVTCMVVNIGAIAVAELYYEIKWLRHLQLGIFTTKLGLRLSQNLLVKRWLI